MILDTSKKGLLDLTSVEFQSQEGIQSDTSANILQVGPKAAINNTYEKERLDLEVVRSIRPEVVRANGTVTVTYDLVNNGTVKLTDIIVKENTLISTRSQTVKTLEPGASAKLTFEKTVGSAGVESSALITYYREGAKTQLRQTLEPVQIPLAKPRFSAELSADKTSLTIGEKATLTLTLKNDGNISYAGINVTDARLGEVFTGLSLAAGETLVQTKEINMETTTTFRFNITLSDNTGVTQSQTTNELNIRL